MTRRNLPDGRILGIETSCDETAAAVIENGRTLLSSVVASQIELHARYGGVFPEVASRQHVKTIYAVVAEALEEAHLQVSDLDALAVTRGPGLAGSLVVGINMAKGMAVASGLPLLGVNHLESHIYSAWVLPVGSEMQREPHFPLLALLVSGGHSELYLMEDHLPINAWGARLMTLPVKPSIKLPGCSVYPTPVDHPFKRQLKLATLTNSISRAPVLTTNMIFLSVV